MLRQFEGRGALMAAVACIAVACSGCGIKGPLRPPPKTSTAPPPPPIDNPARPPATTSPALPPPSSSGDQRL